MKLPPNYVCGFVDGEACFTIVISKHKTKKLGLDARLHFEIELRDDDLKILQDIQETLECGRIYHLNYERYGWHPHVELKVSSIKKIRDKIIPFFKKHPLRGKKRHSFELFTKAAELFYTKEHLTMDGIEKLKKIRQKMNKYSKKKSRVRHGAGKPRAGRRETSKPVMELRSQNTARQASKVSSARSG